MNLVKRIPHTHAQMQTRDSRSYQGESLGLPIPGEYKWYAVREPKFCYYRKIQMACRQGAPFCRTHLPWRGRLVCATSDSIHEEWISCDSQLLRDKVILDPETVSALRMCLSAETFLCTSWSSWPVFECYTLGKSAQKGECLLAVVASDNFRFLLWP